MLEGIVMNYTNESTYNNLTVLWMINNNVITYEYKGKIKSIRDNRKETLLQIVAHITRGIR